MLTPNALVWTAMICALSSSSSWIPVVAFMNAFSSSSGAYKEVSRGFAQPGLWVSDIVDFSLDERPESDEVKGAWMVPAGIYVLLEGVKLAALLSQLGTI